MTDLKPRHIRTDLGRLSANPANNRLKIWRALCRFWVDAGLIEEDPAISVRKRKVASTIGHEPWLWQDVQAFRDRWPIGTMQRLALELAVSTGAARTDLVRLGPGMLDKEGWLSYRRSKSGGVAVVPLLCELPDWMPHNPYLQECLEIAPRHLTWLSTKRGAARSDKALGTWFSNAARDAGISKGKTLHGIRKLLSVTMAENGAPAEQRMAILGHETEAEARNYSKTASLKKIISGTKFSNSTNSVGKSAK
ncbi:tyrosine-type recombinase/integrase [Pseudooceanicola nitratireducens]|uniref:tyrosine-type recombinase/integrase n=1 Tax=Pseudooceanicola nitratireducens TaxID=517719 RepID=UPI0023F52DF1|nr:tyrosine-type recombinase/integrase [Pseudooceanicola nitratireducens]